MRPWYMHGHRRFAAAVVGALAIACSTLPDIPRGTCGNHVLEGGEDCDTSETGTNGAVCRPPGSVGACRFGCGDGNGNAPCPSGWACGGDGICRAAKGQYVAASAAIASDAQSLGVADYDGDGVGDVRESSAVATRIRFGSAAADLATVFRVPTGDSFPATGDLSADGAADLAFSLGGSVSVWRGTHDRTLLPTQYPTLPLPAADVTILPVEALVRHAGAELAFFVPDNILLRDQTNLAGSDDGKGNFVLALITGKKATDLAIRPKAARFDESPNSPCDEIVYAFKNESEVHILPTCVGAQANHPITKLHPDGRVLPSISLGQATIGAAVHVADLNGDGHLDLLIDAPLAGERNVVRALGRGDGTFDPVESVTDYYGQFPLAVGQLTSGDSLPDYVGAGGRIVLRTTPMATASGGNADAGDGGGDAGAIPDASVAVTVIQAPTNVNWTEALIADVNGNGFPDVICGARGQIDFYNGTGMALLDHVPYFIDGSAAGFALGDFDGDLALDIVYRESTVTSTSDDLKVLFGNALALPSAPVSLGSPGKIDVLTAATLGDTTLGRADGLADIGLLLKSADGTQEFLSILLGSPDRELQAPFGLTRARSGNANTFIHAAGAAFAIGNFAPDTGAAHLDLGLPAVDTDPDLTNPNAPRAVRFWLLPATGDAQLDPAQTTASAAELETLTVTSGVATSPTGLNWAAAQSVAIDLDPSPNGALDEIVTLVPPQLESGAAGALFVAHASGGAFTVSDKSRIPLGVDAAGGSGPTAAWRVSAADFDADGALDLLVFLNTAQGPRAEVFFNARSGAIDPTAAVTVPIPAGATALAAAALNADADPAREIALLTDKGIFVAGIEGRTFTLSQAPVASASTKRATAIAAGDVNGDGIDDIAVVAGGVLQLFQGLPVNK